jgi:hypothetical protein
MSFLKPGFGRNGHEEAPPPAAPSPPPAVPVPAAPLDAHQRLLAVLAAELERLEDSYKDALVASEARLAQALADHAALQRRFEELEREHAESQRRVRALRHLLDE